MQKGKLPKSGIVYNHHPGRKRLSDLYSYLIKKNIPVQKKTHAIPE
jgi:hypothetical protein